MDTCLKRLMYEHCAQTGDRTGSDQLFGNADAFPNMNMTMSHEVHLIVLRARKHLSREDLGPALALAREGIRQEKQIGRSNQTAYCENIVKSCQTGMRAM